MSELPTSPADAITHRVTLVDVRTHLFQVSLQIPTPSIRQRIALPVWIPGSYMVREFAKHIQQLRCTQGSRKMAIAALDKSTWEIQNSSHEPLHLTYEVYAFDASVRTAYLDATRGFFNGTSLFMRVLGQEDTPQVMLLESPKPSNWRVGTAMHPMHTDAKGWGSYRAENYDDLVEHPVALGDFWDGQFVIRGIIHRFLVNGAPPSFDGAKLLKDAEKIVRCAMSFWHPKPQQKPSHDRYVFLLNAVYDGYGGLEHTHSTALIARRGDLPQLGALESDPMPQGYIQLLGLISHEYFHTWNVKRLRPAELASYDYSRENHTEMLWFFEGFTSYYDDLLLYRAGLIDEKAYLKLLAKTINHVQQTPGRKIQSLASASFDAWIKYYRPDENSSNSQISYYTKGALVALCLDLQLRHEGQTTLDEVMRALWSRKNRAICEADVLEVLYTLSQRSYAHELKAWVHGTEELPLSALLEAVGVQTTSQPASLDRIWGLRTQSSGGGILKIQQVHRDSPAARAGFAPGDEWLAVNNWRITSLEDIATYAPTVCDALVVRDGRLLTLTFKTPKTVNAGIKQSPLGDVQLLAADLPSQASARSAWLKG